MGVLIILTEALNIVSITSYVINLHYYIFQLKIP